jgi:hypothetical protein
MPDYNTQAILESIILEAHIKEIKDTGKKLRFAITGEKRAYLKAHIKIALQNAEESFEIYEFRSERSAREDCLDRQRQARLEELRTELADVKAKWEGKLN